MIRRVELGVFGLCLLTVEFAGAADIGTAFTYQGHLEKPAGAAVTDTCDFRFSLWDAAAGGNQEGNSPQTVPGVTVADGVFTTPIDFGAAAINGTARWLEIEVRCPTGVGGFSLLTPRVELTPAPHALALPGLYTQQNGTSPNIVAGFSGNGVDPGVVGAAIGGGGHMGFTHRVADNYGTISGGQKNTVGGDDGGVTTGWWATVGGGQENTARSQSSTVAGGGGNRVLDDFGTVGGGELNTAGSDDDNPFSGRWSAVGGGQFNTASGEIATIGGGRSNSTTAIQATVGGGEFNSAAQACTVAGGYNNHASNIGTTVGGGLQNFASGAQDTIAGGTTNSASGGASTVGGGWMNSVSGLHATVSGGRQNVASAEITTVGGGGSNSATAIQATVGGGEFNSSAQACTVGGGFGNQAGSIGSTVGGGLINSATGGQATVAGGTTNQASGAASTVGGGGQNSANAERATVCGGGRNTANAYAATVGGGEDNRAGGQYSIAAGRRAIVRDAAATLDANGDEGVFMWADATDADFTSGGPNQFLVRASSGTTIYSNAALTAGVTLAAGGSAWGAVSDRNLKENFADVDTVALLEGLAAIPITTWNYKSQDDSIRHIGPMGQDFYAVFGVGEEETRITTIDADGVALAAIQGLYGVVKEKECEIEELREQKHREIEELRVRNIELQSRLAALEAAIGELAAQQNRGDQ